MHEAVVRWKKSLFLQPLLLCCACLSATAVHIYPSPPHPLWDSNSDAFRNISAQFAQIKRQFELQNVKLNEINVRLITVRHEVRADLNKLLQLQDPGYSNKDNDFIIDSRGYLPTSEKELERDLRYLQSLTSTSTTSTTTQLPPEPLSGHNWPISHSPPITSRSIPSSSPKPSPQSPPTVTRILPTSCSETLSDPQRGIQGGIFQLQLPAQPFSSSPPSAPFYAFCLPDPQGNGSAWTLVQRRQDGSTDFYRNWADYKRGFGNLNNEFFIGLDRLHALTQSRLHELWIELEDYQGERAHARYEYFAIGDEASKYVLYVLGRYQGNAGDSLRLHAGQRFTTHDADNDDSPKHNCATESHGGWWYADCHDSNLNGKYLKGSYDKADQGKGIDWNSWHGHLYSLKYAHMAIRPV